jgi:hypothetical protein
MLLRNAGVGAGSVTGARGARILDGVYRYSQEPAITMINQAVTGAPREFAV